MHISNMRCFKRSDREKDVSFLLLLAILKEIVRWPCRSRTCEQQLDSKITAGLEVVSCPG